MARAIESGDMIMRLRGFTLIELLIALAIFAFLIMLAGPMYAKFMGNSQIRNAGDGMLNGVQLAQSTAVRGNTLARLVVDPTVGTGGWRILETIEGLEPSPPNPIQVYSLTDGSPNVAVTTTPLGATQITFDGFGRIVDPNVDLTAPITCINVDHATMTGLRSLRVVISNTGTGIGTKLCDPDPKLLLLVPPDPQACPATPCA
jgi:type IV fimbrial biogenesis protein FimT